MHGSWEHQQAQKMVNKQTRLNFLESVAVDNFMKTSSDKMVAIKIESRQMEQNQSKLKLGT